MWIAHYGKSSVSVFQEIFTSANKIFISGRGLSTRPNMKKSQNVINMIVVQKLFSAFKYFEFL